MSQITQTKKKSRIPGLALYIVILVAAFIMLLGVDFIRAGMSFNAITDPAFFVSNAFTDAALLCITFGTVYLYLDWFKLNDDRYKTADDILTKFAQGKTNVPSILSRFLEGFNRKRKINQYKYLIKEKIYKLEKSKSFSDKDLHLWNYGTEEEKALNEYCSKRKMYEELLTDEYIEANINNMNIKYDRVTASVILSNFYTEGPKGQVNDFITKDENGKIIAYRGPRLLLSFGATFLLSSLVLDAIIFNWLALLTFAGKALTISVTAYTSYRYAKKHAITITRHDNEFRASIVTEYDKWLLQEAKTVAEISTVVNIPTATTATPSTPIPEHTSEVFVDSSKQILSNTQN